MFLPQSQLSLHLSCRYVDPQFGVGGVERSGPCGAWPAVGELAHVRAVVGGVQRAETAAEINIAQWRAQKGFGQPVGVRLARQQTLQMFAALDAAQPRGFPRAVGAVEPVIGGHRAARSEERRVGKECRSRWAPYD